MNFNIFQRKKSAVFTKYSALQLMMEPSWSKRDYVSFAEEGYIKNVIAFRAINMIASAASSVPLTLCQLTDQGKSQLKAHPLLKLLYSPNPMTSKTAILIYWWLSRRTIENHQQSFIFCAQIGLKLFQGEITFLISIVIP